MRLKDRDLPGGATGGGRPPRFWDVTRQGFRHGPRKSDQPRHGYRCEYEEGRQAVPKRERGSGRHGNLRSGSRGRIVVERAWSWSLSLGEGEGVGVGGGGGASMEEWGLCGKVHE